MEKKLSRAYFFQFLKGQDLDSRKKNSETI